MIDDPDEPPILAREIVMECTAINLQRFIKDNFGLYSPPGDYRALRAENMRRSLDPKCISQSALKAR